MSLIGTKSVKDRLCPSGQTLYYYKQYIFGRGIGSPPKSILNN
nr:MAG TPA: hypothetical protein [Caudoviricetes sp.]